MTRGSPTPAVPRKTLRFGVAAAFVIAVGSGSACAPAIAPESPRTAHEPAPGVTRDPAPRAACDRWVAPNGDDHDPGTQARPWATLAHAAARVRDRGCTVWFEDGVYTRNTEPDRHFRTQTTFRAIHPYRAVIEGDGYVLDLSGSSHMTFSGFEFRHSGPGSSGIVVYVGGSEARHIAFRDNVFHDSYDDDILKILDGARSVTVQDNVFYNQGPNEQHIDVNSVTDVRIEGNIFFNDFAASGRDDPGDTKAYIVVKDSNENDDRVLGASRIRIQRNIFLNWQGGLESFVKIGNDGKPYFEARNVRIEDNLLIGNSSDEVHAPLGVSGAKGVSFVNNTVVGDLPSSSYAFHVDIKGENRRNEDILFANNIWSDPTRTMDEFSGGDPRNTVRLSLARNLYWNGGDPIPRGELLSPIDDARRVVRDPRLPEDQSDVILPIWDGASFASGSRSILDEFTRLVETYGAIPADSPAVGRALRSLASDRDILGHERDGHPDLGAFEA